MPHQDIAEKILERIQIDPELNKLFSANVVLQKDGKTSTKIVANEAILKIIAEKYVLEQGIYKVNHLRDTIGTLAIGADIVTGTHLSTAIDSFRFFRTKKHLKQETPKFTVADYTQFIYPSMYKSAYNKLLKSFEGKSFKSPEDLIKKCSYYLNVHLSVQINEEGVKAYVDRRIKEERKQVELNQDTTQEKTVHKNKEGKFTADAQSILLVTKSFVEDEVYHKTKKYKVGFFSYVLKAATNFISPYYGGAISALKEIFKGLTRPKQAKEFIKEIKKEDTAKYKYKFQEDKAYMHLYSRFKDKTFNSYDEFFSAAKAELKKKENISIDKKTLKADIYGANIEKKNQKRIS